MANSILEQLTNVWSHFFSWINIHICVCIHIYLNHRYFTFIYVYVKGHFSHIHQHTSPFLKRQYQSLIFFMFTVNKRNSALYLCILAIIILRFCKIYFPNYNKDYVPVWAETLFAPVLPSCLHIPLLFLPFLLGSPKFFPPAPIGCRKFLLLLLTKQASSF